MGKVPKRRDCRENTRFQSISFTVECPVSRAGEPNAIRYGSPGKSRHGPDRTRPGSPGIKRRPLLGTLCCWCCPRPWIERSPRSGVFGEHGRVYPPACPTRSALMRQACANKFPPSSLGQRRKVVKLQEKEKKTDGKTRRPSAKICQRGAGGGAAGSWGPEPYSVLFPKWKGPTKA
ncbi:hypothetical protein DQ04_14341000 [Trypanosoma grayi]|uniref:hypothetical protein n=1 Tax=Trypanosoma grayi TaxID=71804 RepID=UPI0004F4BE3B|nr:hypothetical protein DQ04_14341000 [Trypanosoma grayi]KEG06373.1 hypothetical protein DQ04_14341000 [Trypanosoma grayi]